MTEEEYFRKHYPDSCRGDKPLSPYWDFFQDGVEFGERQSEKKIEELEKENRELKEQNRNYEQLIDNGSVTLVKERLKNYKQLTKAIGIIKRWYETNRSACIEPSQELIEVTEQFLKEIEK